MPKVVLPRCLRVLALPVALVALLSACEPKITAPSFQIEDIGWVYENIDTSYWTGGFNAATCFVRFSIYYSGDVTLADIASARWREAGSSTYWSFPIDATHVDLAKKRISTDLCYATHIAANGSALPIGSLVFEVSLAGGTTTSFSFDAPTPGALSSAGNTVTYTEDFTDPVLSGYVPMLKRPVLASKSKTASNITISFSSADSIFYSGWVWFYDASGTYVGKTSSYFRTYSEGVVWSAINGGISINNAGGANTLSLGSSDIVFAAGKAWSDIASYQIVLTDGTQYLGTGHSYDCMAIGALDSF